MKQLRIYAPFAINEFKTQLSYRGAFYLFMVISTFGAFVSFFLWSAIPRERPEPQVLRTDFLLEEEPMPAEEPILPAAAPEQVDSRPP